MIAKVHFPRHLWRVEKLIDPVQLEGLDLVAEFLNNAIPIKDSKTNNPAK